jgi:hypothetical protein
MSISANCSAGAGGLTAPAPPAVQAAKCPPVFLFLPSGVVVVAAIAFVCLCWAGRATAEPAAARAGGPAVPPLPLILPTLPADCKHRPDPREKPPKPQPKEPERAKEADQPQPPRRAKEAKPKPPAQILPELLARGQEHFKHRCQRPMALRLGLNAGSVARP